ncbi:MAG: NAD(P)H-dependent oxidoreductase [Psychrobium sp.]|nr:NAD(P)H-dependent oxidoreductase [Psychrobium sp.]
MKILHIKSSILGEHSVSNQLSQAYLSDELNVDQQANVTVRDFAEQSIPHIDGALLGALGTAAEERNSEQSKMVAFADLLISEISESDVIVLGLPMYNFGAPSMLKAYFDQIARAGSTFSYTENGPVGLLNDKEVIVFATRGGLYQDTPQDTQTPFIRNFFAFIGITNVKFVYAEGLQMGDEMRDKGLAQAKSMVEKLSTVAA